jgi:SAM-dependent methyltransferase
MLYRGQELDVFATAVGWKSYVREKLAAYIEGAVLEVGAGIGSFTGALQGLNGSSWCCLEPDPSLAQKIQCRKSEGSLRHDTTVIEGTLAALAPEAKFDTILYIDVLEHIRDAEEEVRHAKGFLRRGGRIIVLAPAFSWLYSPFDEAIGHWRRYDRVSLDHIRPAGLWTEAAWYMDALGLTLSLANRMMLRSHEPSQSQIAFWDRFVIPVTRWIDPLVAFGFGRSVVVVWQCDSTETR